MEAVNFLYDLKIFKYIEFLFEREFMLLIPTYCRVPRVGNTDEIQTAAAGQTGQTPKTID